MTEAIITEALTKAYGPEQVVHGLSITVNRGEVFGLLGPNAAGKSTVVDLLAGTLAPTSGAARLLGEAPGTKSLRRRVGFLPADLPNSRWLAGADYLAAYAKRAGMNRSEISIAVDAALKSAGCENKANIKLHLLSSSMHQRLRLAVALVTDPEVVVLDEPTSCLDNVGQRDVIEIVRQLQARDKSVLVTGNHLSELEMCCDTIAIMKNGHSKVVGKPTEMLANCTIVDVEVERLNDPALSAIREIGAKMKFHSVPIQRFSVWVKSGMDIPVIASAIVNCGVNLLQLTPRRETADELFIRLLESL